MRLGLRKPAERIAPVHTDPIEQAAGPAGTHCSRSARTHCTPVHQIATRKPPALVPAPRAWAVMGGGRCFNAVGTAFIVGFYLVTSLVYFREQIQRSSYFAQPPQHTALLLVSKARPAVHMTPSALAVPVVDGWGAARLLAQQPIHLVAAGMPAAGDTWQFNVLRIILEEALSTYGVQGPVLTAVLHGKDKSSPEQQKQCRAGRCIIIIISSSITIVIAPITTPIAVDDILVIIY